MTDEQKDNFNRAMAEWMGICWHEEGEKPWNHFHTGLVHCKHCHELYDPFDIHPSALTPGGELNEEARGWVEKSEPELWEGFLEEMFVWSTPTPRFIGVFTAQHNALEFAEYLCGLETWGYKDCSDFEIDEEGCGLMADCELTPCNASIGKQKLSYRVLMEKVICE